MPDFSFRMLSSFKKSSIWYDICHTNWPLIASFAWYTYEEYGRGAVIVDRFHPHYPAELCLYLEEPSVPVAMDYAHAADLTEQLIVEPSLDGSEIQVLQDLIATYDPRVEAVVLLIHPSGEAEYTVMRGDPEPPAAPSLLSHIPE